MMAGARIIAPEGYEFFEKDKVYYFLNSNTISNRVKLVMFEDQEGGITSELIVITQVHFEEALEQGFLLENGRDDAPPWLESIRGYSVAYLESRRLSMKENYDQKVDRRFLAISDLVARYKEVVDSEDSDKIINAHAKSQSPQQNARRLRVWFYSYVIFGFNKWALMPPLHRIGGWNRESHTNKKLGRPSPKGRKAGYACTQDMKSKILSGVLKHKDSYRKKADLWNEILVKEFGCVVKIKDGVRHYSNLKAEPFPSVRQMEYWTQQMIGPKALARELKGKNKARSQSGSTGSFAERLTNLCQSVEFDGYYISEKLTGVTEGSAVDSFCVVRAVCGLSGAVLGIGFAEGRETLEAYKMALFCMAVDKVKFCELFGLRIKPDEWPSIGLPGDIIFDRGPGAAYDSEPEINWLGSIELTQSYSGQSKATVESSHPRDKKNLEQPTYFQSQLNFVLMARREIFRVLADNQDSDASGRTTEEMIINEVKPTPHGIWNFLDGRGRNSAIGMPFDEAVRTFLTVHPATIRKNAVYFYGRKYRSEALVDTQIFDRVARNGVIKCSAYALTMCVRHIWVEFEGLLYELDVVISAATVDGSVEITLPALMRIDELRRAAKAALREEKPAIEHDYRERFKNDTGADWAAGHRKTGKPSKGGAAYRDKADYNNFIGKVK